MTSAGLAIARISVFIDCSNLQLGLNRREGQARGIETYPFPVEWTIIGHELAARGWAAFVTRPDKIGSDSKLMALARLPPDPPLKRVVQEQHDDAQKIAIESGHPTDIAEYHRWKRLRMISENNAWQGAWSPLWRLQLTYICGSYVSPSDEIVQLAQDKSGAPEIRWSLFARKAREPRVCRKCETRLAFCSSCGADLGMEEKQVDVAIATEMVRLACEGKYDIAILASEDSDLVPAVKCVRDTGKVVIQASSGGGNELAAACFNTFDAFLIRDRLEEFGQ